MHGPGLEGRESANMSTIWKKAKDRPRVRVARPVSF